MTKNKTLLFTTALATLLSPLVAYGSDGKGL